MLNIKASLFEQNTHETQKAGNNLYGYYKLHNLDVYNVITIDNKEYQAVYQTGQSFLHNDYNCPDPDLAMSTEGGASHELYLISYMYESDFNDDAILNDILSELKDLKFPAQTKDDLFQVWEFLKDNLPMIENYIDND